MNRVSRAETFEYFYFELCRDKKPYYRQYAMICLNPGTSVIYIVLDINMWYTDMQICTYEAYNIDFLIIISVYDMLSNFTGIFGMWACLT